MLGVRVSAFGARQKPQLALAAWTASAAPEPKSLRSVYLHSKRSFVDVPIYDADGIQTHDVVAGPAVLESATTTILVPEEYTMQCDQLGSYVLRREESK